MADPDDLDDWEVLSASNSGDDPTCTEETTADGGEISSPDYFVLDRYVEPDSRTPDSPPPEFDTAPGAGTPMQEPVAGFKGIDEAESRNAGSEIGDGQSPEMGDSDDLVSGVNVSAGEGESRVPVWLKPPLEFVKLCVSRARPVWSISIAAGIIGVLMLGRRLYELRRKRPLKVKVGIGNKKALVHAAHLKEVFSVVRRVLVLRSTPPATGVTLWPVAGLL